MTIFLLIINSFLEKGGLSKSSDLGGSVDKANDANEFIIRFIQSNYTGCKGDSFNTIAPNRVVISAARLTVIWNYKNFLMFSLMLRPQRHAFTMEAKLSSRRIISAANLATSVPVIPMANPTSAFFKAGASLVPSPVTATTSPHSLKAVTRTYLSSGLDLARTFSLLLICLNISMFLTPSLTFSGGQLHGLS